MGLSIGAPSVPSVSAPTAKASSADSAPSVVMEAKMMCAGIVDTGFSSTPPGAASKLNLKA